MFQIRIFEDKEYVVKLDDGRVIFIPEDNANFHYQEYLAWIAEGNEPEVIDDQI